MELPKPGVYRHFKGNYYRLLFVAEHTETREPMAVYQALYGKRGCWVRPLAMWSETVEAGGASVQRFAYVCDTEAEIPTET
jgi:hypothetical protein